MDKYKARRARRQQLSLARWERERAKGHTRFVLHQALTFTVSMTAFQDVYQQIFEQSGPISRFWFHIIFYSMGGIVAGFFTWSNQEATYKNALLNRRLQTPFDDRIKPQ